MHSSSGTENEPLLADAERELGAVESASHSFVSTGTHNSKSTTHAGQQIPLLHWLSKVNFGPHGQISGADVNDSLEYQTMLDLLPVSVTDGSGKSAEAIYSVTANGIQRSGKNNLTHERLRQFIVEEFDLGTYGMSPDDVCAICMPNGAEAAVTLLATMCYCTAVPLSAQETSEELRKALKRTEAQLVIVMKGCDNDPVTTAASELGLSVVEFASHPYVIGLTTANGIISGRIRKQKERVASSPNNIALMLHTSGTSGNQKLVPYTVSTIVVGSACIAKAWDLGPGDVGLNMMPLFHVGGIMRNLVGPILSGSAMVCCATFDSELFWTVARSYGVTWYYGSPTMHHMVLQAGKTVEDVKPLRFIANAAGGLLPSMAEELREKFKACVLPSYGMTECMPISTPPLGYSLDRPGTSGVMCGPEIKIFDLEGRELKPHQTGLVVLKGMPCFNGYLNNEEANKESFFDGNWFNTGDCGYLDNDGFLFITGRMKEIINRGGETISPFEIEDAVKSHPEVEQCMAFSAPHNRLQECVGIALVTKTLNDRSITLSKLQRFLTSKLHPSKWPQVVVYIDRLPQGPTGKILRIRFASRCDLPEIRDSSSLEEKRRTQHFEAIGPEKGAPLKEPIVTKSYVPAISKGNSDAELTYTEKNVVEVWFATLDLEPGSLEINKESNFFELGGGSMLAGKLASRMRKKFNLAFTAEDVFINSTVESMAAILVQRGFVDDESAANSCMPSCMPGFGNGSDIDLNKGYGNRSSTNCVGLVLPWIPILIVAPILRAAFWVVYAGLWLFYMNELGIDRFWALILSILTTGIIKRMVFPIILLISKWTIIGRYREGGYPLFGFTYWRWWYINRLHVICGPGYFALNNTTRILWLRMMGATVGKNVKVGKTFFKNFGEYDLLTIQDDVAIDDAVVRAQVLDSGLMVFAPINIGKGSSVCMKSVIVPGASIPPDTHIGPLSSSHEINDAAPHYKNYCRPRFPAPATWIQMCFGQPILILVSLISLLPWLAILFLMVNVAANKGVFITDLRTPYHLVVWFTTDVRIYFYLANRASKFVLKEFIVLLEIIILKACLIGKFTPGSRTRSQWYIFKHWLMNELWNKLDWSLVSSCVGPHYNIVSSIYAALGVKVGERIFWPGSGIATVEFDLIEVGDDCVFGSRSYFMPCDAEIAAPIVLGAGAMVADRCVLLPGTNVDKLATLGSGTLGRKDGYYPKGSTWIGNRDGEAVQLEKGSQDASSMDTISPFGKGFYQREASYFVWPQFLIVPFNMIWVMCATILKVGGPTIGALLSIRYVIGMSNQMSYGTLYWKFTVSYSIIWLILLIYIISVRILLKWVIIGQLRPGSYDFDKSNYIQRWKLNVLVGNITRRIGNDDLPSHFNGTWYLCAYFRAMGAKIGKDVCLYPNGADPPMTEPDVVSIGDRAMLDQCSIIGHINSRGKFSINQVRIGASACLRSWTRLQSGAEIEDGGKMLEHTLVLGGDIVDSGSSVQGWPRSLTQRNSNV